MRSIWSTIVINLNSQDALAEVKAEMKEEEEEERRRRRRRGENEEEGEEERRKRRRSKQEEKSTKSRDSFPDSTSRRTRSGKQSSSKSKKERVKSTIADLTESIREEIVVDNSERTEQVEVETEKTEFEADYEQDFESVIPTETDLSSADDTLSKS